MSFQRLLLAAFLLATPAAATGQPPETQAIPPETLVPNEEARALFETLRSNVLTDEMLAAMIAAMPGGSAAPIDNVIEQLFARGARVPGWDNSGIDPRAIMAALDGGLAGNMTESVTDFGPSRGYYSDRPLDAFIHPDWILVGRRGAAVEGEIIGTGITRISPKVILAERSSIRRQGNAYCRVSAESRIYADPSVSASELDMIAVVITMRTLAIMDGRSICSVTEAASEGQHRQLAFDAEGYRLPALDQQFRIVPAAATARQP